MLRTTSLTPMAHLICVAHTRLELAEILVAFRKAGVENLMALGGDPPPTPTAGRASSPRRSSSSSWPGPSAASPSAWPPTRPATRPRPTWRVDRRSAGGQARAWPTSPSPSSSSRPSEYLGLVADLAARGVTKPVLPGIMPVTTPPLGPPHGPDGGGRARLGRRRLEAADARGGDDAVRQAGIELATELCEGSWPTGRPGLHFYTLNRSSATQRDLRRPRAAGHDGKLSAWPSHRALANAHRLAVMAEKITMGADGVLTSPTSPSSPSSRVTAPASTSGRPPSLVFDAAAAKHGRTIAWKEVLAGREGVQGDRRLAARRDRRRLPRATSSASRAR